MHLRVAAFCAGRRRGGARILHVGAVVIVTFPGPGGFPFDDWGVNMAGVLASARGRRGQVVLVVSYHGGCE